MIVNMVDAWKADNCKLCGGPIYWDRIESKLVWFCSDPSCPGEVIIPNGGFEGHEDRKTDIFLSRTA